MHPKSSRPASSEIPHASALYIVRHLAPCIVQHPFASQIVVPGKTKNFCPRLCQHRPTFSFLVLCNSFLYLKSLNQPIFLSGVISLRCFVAGYREISDFCQMPCCCRRNTPCSMGREPWGQASSRVRNPYDQQRTNFWIPRSISALFHINKQKNIRCSDADRDRLVIDLLWTHKAFLAS